MYPLAFSSLSLPSLFSPLSPPSFYPCHFDYITDALAPMPNRKFEENGYGVPSLQPAKTTPEEILEVLFFIPPSLSSSPPQFSVLKMVFSPIITLFLSTDKKRGLKNYILIYNVSFFFSYFFVIFFFF